MASRTYPEPISCLPLPRRPGLSFLESLYRRLFPMHYVKGLDRKIGDYNRVIENCSALANNLAKFERWEQRRAVRRRNDQLRAELATLLDEREAFLRGLGR